METLNIFVVDDDITYATLLEYSLSRNPDYQIKMIHSGTDLLNNLHLKPDIITLDYTLPDYSGEQILKKLQQSHPSIPVVVISGQEDIETAINLLKDGAYDYLVKNDETTQRLWKTIQNIRENISLKEEVKQLRAQVQQKFTFDKLIKGNSPALQKVFKLIEKACKTNITVSINGETGTGKELVAQAIHYNSLRKDNDFVAINMAAIPSELIESELFGHEKGSFTGAHARKIGMFEQANKGTIFLDEIGDMNLNMQAKLLRVLQEKEVQRIGGNKKIKIDTRVIVATHKNLAEEVKEKRFRSDLYYRLLGLPIQLPPLRDRGNDVLLLSSFFIDAFCKDNNMPSLKLSSEAKKKLLKYHYPGNVRELKAIMDLAIVQADGEQIEADDVTFHAINPVNDLLIEEKTLKEYNRDIIRFFLDKHDQDINIVAERLDIGKSTIYGMKKKGEL